MLSHCGRILNTITTCYLVNTENLLCSWNRIKTIDQTNCEHTQALTNGPHEIIPQTTRQRFTKLSKSPFNWRPYRHKLIKLSRDFMNLLQLDLSGTIRGVAGVARPANNIALRLRVEDGRRFFQFFGEKSSKI